MMFRDLEEFVRVKMITPLYQNVSIQTKFYDTLVKNYKLLLFLPNIIIHGCHIIIMGVGRH